MRSSNSHKSSHWQGLRVALWRTRSHIKANGTLASPVRMDSCCWEWWCWLWLGEKEGVLWFPGGHVFSPSPCPAPVSSLTQDQTSSLPPLLLPSCLLAPQLEVHLLYLISRLAMGYVYHQCTIFVAEVCMPHLGIGYQVQMGSPFKKATKALASSARTATGTECWNPIIHLISICSIPLSLHTSDV